MVLQLLVLFAQPTLFATRKPHVPADRTELLALALGTKVFAARISHPLFLPLEDWTKIPVMGNGNPIPIGPRPLVISLPSLVPPCNADTRGLNAHLSKCSLALRVARTRRG